MDVQATHMSSKSREYRARWKNEMGTFTSILYCMLGKGYGQSNCDSDRPGLEVQSRYWQPSDAENSPSLAQKIRGARVRGFGRGPGVGLQSGNTAPSG